MRTCIVLMPIRIALTREIGSVSTSQRCRSTTLEEEDSEVEEEDSVVEEEDS